MFSQVFASPLRFQMIAAVILFVMSHGETQADTPRPQLITSEIVRSEYEDHAKSWAALPKAALEAIVAAEDADFYTKAAQNSTITQPLGKRYIKQAMRTALLRTIQYYNASILARELSHAEILNWYAHEIWLGEGCFGLLDAAQAYFGKQVDELDVQDLAFLAALIRSPVRYHPVQARVRAVERRNRVLDEMKRMGYITGAEATKAVAADLIIREPLQRCVQ